MIAAEQETTITYDSEEKLVRIFTARARDQSKLRRKGVSPVRGTLSRGFFYEIPLAALSWTVRPSKLPAQSAANPDEIISTHSNHRPRKVNLSGLVKHRASLHRKGIP